MKTARLHASWARVFGAVAWLLAAAPGLAADPNLPVALVLEPGRSVGDRYTLRLEREVEDEVAGSERPESVKLDYRALVQVLEVDETGRITRERHSDVRMNFERPEEFGSMFKEDTVFEVRREEDIQLFVRGERVARQIEEPVVEMLEGQFAATVAPRLLQPRVAVALGDSWPLDAELTKEYLRSLGLRAISVFEPTASFARDDETGERGISFEIPIGYFLVPGLPVELRISETTALLRGRVHLDAAGNVDGFAQDLVLELHGVSGSVAQGTANPFGLVRSRSDRQATGDATFAPASLRPAKGGTSEPHPAGRD